MNAKAVQCDWPCKFWYFIWQKWKQIDHILFSWQQLIDWLYPGKEIITKNTRDVKVICNEECITQHKLLVADITAVGQSPKPRIVPPRR